MNLRINREIRALRLRVISHDGQQLGILTVAEALRLAEEQGLDLVEISPSSNPPVCKIIDYGKFRYDQTKKEKENKKAQLHVKTKEVKLKPNIDGHDLEVKLRHARDFLTKGNKVKVTLMFRGREMAHPEVGQKLIEKMCQSLEDIATVETMPKIMGRFLTMVIAPGKKKKSTAETPTESKATP